MNRCFLIPGRFFSRLFCCFALDEHVKRSFILATLFIALNYSRIFLPVVLCSLKTIYFSHQLFQKGFSRRRSSVLSNSLCHVFKIRSFAFVLFFTSLVLIRSVLCDYINNLTFFSPSSWLQRKFVRHLFRANDVNGEAVRAVCLPLFLIALSNWCYCFYWLRWWDSRGVIFFSKKCQVSCCAANHRFIIIGLNHWANIFH